MLTAPTHAYPLYLAPDPARFNLYRPVHKGLRRDLALMLARLGSLDLDEAPERTATLEALRGLLQQCGEHLEHEDRFVHPALEARAPGGSQHAGHAHVEHQHTLEGLRALTDEVDVSSSEERGALAHQLYLHFSRFVGESLLHMAEEEQELLARLHAHFSDPELMGLEGQIIASLPPARVLGVMRSMLPAMSRPERAAFLRMVREGAPAGLFEALLQGAARPVLGDADWADLQGRLAAAP